MEAVQRTWSQFLDLYRSMSPSQRGTLIVVPVLVAAAFGLLMVSDRSSSYVALSWGKVFTTEELINAEQTLIEAQLTEFRRDGQRLLVPTNDVERYNAALLEAGSLPSDWGSELEKQIESDGIFTSDRQSSARKDIALAKELRRILRAVPDIEDASVIWARPHQGRRWPSTNQKVTATVNVRPKRGRELSMQLVQSLRAAVANMVPDLSAADVTVFDQTMGKSYTPDQDGDPFDSKLLERIKQFTQMHQNMISNHLSAYIPNVVVTVRVDLDNLKSSVTREQTVDPKKTVALRQSEEDRTESFREQPYAAEPGAGSNVPRQLVNRGGTDRVRSMTDKSTQNVTAPSFSVTEKELIAAMPRAVQVSVAIPKDYYRAVALKQQQMTDSAAESTQELSQGELDAVEATVLRDVKATVTTLIPPGSPENAIHVNSYVRIDPEVPEVETPLAESVMQALSQWGGAIGLALFALWALRMLYKTTPKLPEDPMPSAKLAFAGPDDEPDEAEEPVRQITPRDTLQGLVRDNPEMTAAVLSKWIKAAK